MLFGAAYYPEYRSARAGADGRIDRDIALMQAAGFTYVRVGESTWHLWEPRDGEFRFDWIEPVIDRCRRAGIATILGMPTYAVPAWLARRYPEIMAQPRTGGTVHYGGRQNVDITHGAYRFHAERVIRAAVGHFAAHPGVIGYQVDNETGVHLLHNPGVRQRFADHLKQVYGSVDVVNAAWGTTHWSLNLADWADLWPADHNSSPGYDLAWRRFQSGLTVEFLSWQAAIVRQLARDDQFVTHCCVGGHEPIRPAGDSRAIARIVDRHGVNPYYSTQDSLTLPDAHQDGPVPAWSVGEGVWALYLQADLARTAAHRGFLALESNAGNAGYPHENYPAWDGQWHQAALALVARGAEGIGYWHWHSCHTGKEIYWRGILGHDDEPGRCYAEVVRIGADLAALAPTLDGARADVDVAFLYSQDSKYALGFLSPLPRPDSNEPDPHPYEQVFNTFYRGYFDAGLQVGCVDPDEDLSVYPVVVVPACYVMSDALAARLVGYAEAGGHLVLTFRTGYADEYGRARDATAPGPLAAAAGVSYREYTNLRLPVRVEAAEGTPVSDEGAIALAWADALELAGAEALFGYDHPHLGRHPAVSTHRYGAGRVTWVGTLPNPALARNLAAWTAAAAGIHSPWTDLPASVRVDSMTCTNGDKVWFLGNWLGEPAAIRLPFPAHNPLTSISHTDGETLRLGPHQTVVLVDAPPAVALPTPPPQGVLHEVP